VLDVSSENLLHSVFQTLAYADIFDYPFTAQEVYRYIPSGGATAEEIDRALSNKTFFTQVGDYFTLRGREKIAETRKQRATIAARLWPKAIRYGRIIARLPFVRMVAVTGSLAMDNTQADQDIDYMIITAPGHLWACRALSLLVARWAKLEGVKLCPNYLVTTNALTFKERSLYVAHELAQMVPLSGLDIYREIRSLNLWIHEFLPNALLEPELLHDLKPKEGSSFFQKALEVPFRLPFVTWLEKWEMGRKIERLTREQSSSIESYFSADICKGHIDRHKQKTENAIAETLERIAIEL
jgi:hypothetical protein